ncbi:hypothetical protein RIF29_17179 [Crotalaria pallida]|uniref:Exocyst subunit Exo70 family protein n=1 Tax=Crotalaria pallida TaxID=3830 RepID=A0AAN9FQ23_CROPI
MITMPIKIQRCLMQPKVYRFVGFVSAVVGLLCYALSSSFNHLFGHWNFFKIFLYFIFSFIICFMTLFAKLWQFSTSVLFKAHVSVLVLIATSVYSFFYDKAVNGKPDTYILASCVAFAVMSLSLSIQTHLGCEVDFQNFFSGCLIILLMKINWLLFIGGAIFSYSLLILRSSLLESEFSEHRSQDRSQDQVVIQVDSQEANINSALIMSQFMACINELKEQNEIIVRKLYSHVDMISVAQLLIEDNFLAESLPSKIINSLETSIKLMVAAGFEKECCRMYSSCRREFLEECLRLYELDLNMDGVSLDITMQKWMIASYAALRILFPSEKRLYGRIFFGFSSASDFSLMEVCWDLTIGLLNYANDLATASHWLNHLRCNLRVFHILTDLIPEFESVFSDHYGASLKNAAITIRKRSGEAIRTIFMELEKHICCDMVQKALPKDGRIDPITYLVESCFSVVLEDKDTVERVFKEYPMDMIGDRERVSSSLSILMAQMMELLYSNLESKCKNYTDPALGYFFIMNNCNCMIHRIKYSEMATVLGDDWILKHSTKFQQNLEHYQRTWVKVSDILELENNQSVEPNAEAESMKEKLKLFNMQFKEMCSVQSAWYVFNEQLREQIRMSIGRNLLPAYGNFIGRFQNLLGEHAYEYIEYGMDDIDARLNCLFCESETKSREQFREGRVMKMSKRVRRPSQFYN